MLTRGASDILLDFHDLILNRIGSALCNKEPIDPRNHYRTNHEAYQQFNQREAFIVRSNCILHGSPLGNRLLRHH
jgi:hypothetical protein